MFQGPGEAGQIGAAQAGFALTVEHLDAGVTGGKVIGDFARAVGRSVVDHKHLDVRAASQYLGGQQGKVFALVIGREENKGRAGAGHAVVNGTCTGYLHQLEH